ncbi:MAG: choice-of-anchor D domain-containing protein [Leptolyngbyaceae cyanobacterium bins.302]|nr:choice-of-anchor D domain-containing protein [Leptolyngbyaceae cyanobacterium bins.302]
MPDLSLTRATYLGTNGTDRAAAIAVSPVDGTYIVAANFNGFAQLQRFDATPGTAPLSDIALAGSDARDMDVNRSNGAIAVVGNFGIQLLDSTGTVPLWQQPGSFDRVAIANDGTVVTLNTTTDTLTLWSNAGVPLATTTLTGGDVRSADVAIDPTTGRIFVTGYTQVTADLQTPFVIAFDSSGASLNLVWDTWNYSAAQVLGAGLAADTRGLRLDVGADGGLYFLGKTDGGNTVFTRDGDNINTSLGSRLVDPDQYTDTSNTSGAKTFAFYAKLNPNDGTIERGQLLVTRLSNGQANSFDPTAITADAAGNVYVGGSAAFQIADRNNQTINGQPVGSYTLGEPAILSVTPDFQTRRFWTALTRTGDTNGSVGSVAGFAVGATNVAFVSTISSPDVATIATDLTPNALGGNDVYLAIVGPSLPLPEINVQDGAVTIIDGSTTPIDFGTVLVGNSLTRSFTLSNLGTGDLSLTGLSLPTGFNLVGTLPSTIAVSNAISVTVQVDTSVAGTFAGIISLTNNDSDENPFDFAIQARVKGANNAPVVAVPLLDQSATATNAFQYTIAPGSFIDPDNDPLTLNASLTGGNPLPSWLSFDTATLSFTGTPASSDIESLSIVLTVDDGFGGSVTDTFVLTIAPAPILPINGTDESETIGGTANRDRIFGWSGHDILSGGLDGDEIFGGEGNDRLYGQDGNDQLFGEVGNDQLFGDEGDDWLWGDAGDDLLYGGAGSDRLLGGTGNDILTGDGGADVFVLATGTGTDVIRDFRLGDDQIGLSGGLTVGQLSITQRSSQTWIRDTSTSELLARLEGVSAANLMAQSATAFVIV